MVRALEHPAGGDLGQLHQVVCPQCPPLQGQENVPLVVGELPALVL